MFIRAQLSAQIATFVNYAQLESQNHLGARGSVRPLKMFGSRVALKCSPQTIFRCRPSPRAAQEEGPETRVQLFLL